MPDPPGLLRSLVLVGEGRGSRAVAGTWCALGLLSLAVATIVALQPGAMQDLWLVRSWLAHYWIERANPYTYFVGGIDYPPQAFLVLAPILAVPEAFAPAVIIALHVATLAAAGWILARWITERVGVPVGRADLLVLTAMLFAGGASRGAVWRGQTMGLAMLLGALALRGSTTRPFLAGLWLGICTFKPHVAIGFALAIWLTGRRIVIAYALLVAAALVVAFSIRLHEPAVPILETYVLSLLSMYEGPDSIPGLLSVRWILDDLIGHGAWSLFVYLVLALSAAYPLYRAARRHDDSTLTALLATAALVWSVVFLPYQLYGWLLVVPAVWLLMWPEAGVLSGSANRTAIVGAILAFYVLDVPRSIRLAASGLGGPAWIIENSYYLSPLLPAALLVLLLAAIARRARPVSS